MKPKICVPFDFSENAEQALAWAVDLQQTTGAGPIAMVHAISSQPATVVGMNLELALPGEDEIGALERAMVDAARKRGGQASAEVIIRPSAVGNLVLDYARARGVNLIAMGTHGRTGIKRLLLGSVAEHVVRHSSCPVVIVRGAATQEASSASPLPSSD